METGKPQNPEKLGFEASPCALIVCSAVEKNRKGQSTIVQKGFTMQTRRDFVKNAATPLILAGIAGTSVVGDANAEEAFEWDEETDVLVVGGGLAGMAAAVTVATEGDGATCLLLEKGASELGGGNSFFSSSCVLYGADGDEDNVFEFLKELRHDDAYGTPDDVLQAYATELCQNYRWLSSLGMDDAQVTFIPGGSNVACFPEYPELEHASACYTMMFSSGSYGHVVNFMYEVIQTLPQITHKTLARLTSLVQDPQTKEILGGVYEYDGAEVRVRANKGVVLTCGGFENSREMMNNYFSQPTVKPVAAQNNTGDVHQICKRLGAAEWHMNCGAGFWNTVRKLDDSGWVIYNGAGNPKKEFGIMVGKNARRFYMDVDACCTNFWDDVNAGWSIDEAVGSRHGHMQFGGDWHLLPMPETSWFIFDQDALEAGVYAQQGEDPVADGFGYSADTIEELAEKAGLSAANLVETIETWNSYCDAGKDLSFFRPASTLTPIRRAPFYILHCEPQMLNTDGGPVRNAQGAIIDLDGNPIPRLFSAGEFGSVWSGHYQGAGNLGECLAFGRISARSALQG